MDDKSIPVEWLQSQADEARENGEDLVPGSPHNRSANQAVLVIGVKA